MKITTKQLKKMGACKAGIRKFKELFGDEMKVNLKNLRKIGRWGTTTQKPFKLIAIDNSKSISAISVFFSYGLCPFLLWFTWTVGNRKVDCKVKSEIYKEIYKSEICNTYNKIGRASRRFTLREITLNQYLDIASRQALKAYKLAVKYDALPKG